jgi:hypothetical protein
MRLSLLSVCSLHGDERRRFNSTVQNFVHHPARQQAL